MLSTGKLQTINPKKVAVFRALQLGDMLCAIPAIKSLKHAFPAAEITLLGLPWAKSFTERFSDYFSGFIHFPGFPGLPEQIFQPKAFIDFLNKVVSEEFDLVLQLQGNGSIVNPLVASFGAKHVAGYYFEGQYCPDETLFMQYPEDLPEVKKHLQLMQYLGIESASTEMELPVTVQEKENFNKLIKQYTLGKGEYICIHAGARDKRRWWSVQNFAAAADYLTSKGYQIVLTGTEAERDTAEKVAAHMHHPSVSLVGKTGLGELAELVRNAKMVLSNDTGISHVAAAVKTPSVIIFLASDPNRWAPLNKTLHKIILPDEAEKFGLVIQKADEALSLKSIEPVDYL